MEATRTAARAANEKRFFSGLPCRQGHVAERRVYNGECQDCRREGEGKPALGTRVAVKDSHAMLMVKRHHTVEQSRIQMIINSLNDLRLKNELRFTALCHELFRG